MITEAQRAWWIDWLGADPDPDGSLTLLDERRVGDWTGRVLRLRSFGDDLDCLLVLPDGDGPHPLVIMPFYEVEPLFGLVGRRPAAPPGQPSRAFGSALLTYGLAVLAVPWWFEVTAADDAPLDLAGRYGPPAARHAERLPSTGLGRSVADLRLVVDKITEPGAADRLGLAGVDLDRIGVFGHSLGGKLALHLAALDERIAAAVAHEPGLGLDHSNWDAPWYLGDHRPPDRDHDQLLGLVAPRPFLLIGGGDSDGPANLPLAERARPAWPDPYRLSTLLHDHGHPPPAYVVAACGHWLAEALRS
ncbi:dienelactone hydrolase family protein [Microlunatus parietis]|uniref:Dienelactone hydrolase n=1 Tax=Microlunatus parietis TaxID=682979 RepID=A0A7Y9LAR1_9ACTN|nr:acetylxylan esterase [Microlunatus parietis]NYE69855.1 dienelactone hydrolase [Microlunatus parietis]